MIPIGDNTPRRRAPVVNYLIVAFTVAIFIFELSLGTRLDAFIGVFGAVPARISAALAGSPRVSTAVLWTLLTSVFLHAGWIHILGNMLFLWVFGDNVEDRLGHFRYLLFYLACGVGAGLVQVVVDPGSLIPAVGASGAIAGVLGAYLLLYPRAWVKVLIPIFIILIPIDLPVIVVLGVWFVTQLANGAAAITQTTQATGGVAYWAHIGGFAIGMLLVLIMPKSADIRPAAVAGRVYALDAGASPTWLRRLVAFVGDAIAFLIVLRIVILLFAPALAGDVRVFAAVFVALSDPLVRPFAGMLPMIRIGGGLIELAAVLALLVYHLLIAALIWLLSALNRTPAPRYH